MKHLLARIAVLVAVVLAPAASALSGVPGGPVRRAPASYDLHVSAGWNLLCVPVAIGDSLASAVYPSAISQPFAFSGGYVGKDTVAPGIGYWVKFAAPDTLTVAGDSLLGLSVPLKAGWNMIGGFTVPMPASLLYTEPLGLLVSKCFRFVPGAGYVESDTMQPGLGYWVKAAQDGTLYLTQPGAGSGFNPQLRTAILDSVNAHVNALPGTDHIADNLALLAYLRTIPQFEASDTLQGGVWARFTDGRMFIYTNNFDLTPVPGDSVNAPSAPWTDKTTRLTPADDLPLSANAWINNSLGSLFYNMPGGGVVTTMNQIRQWLASVGYKNVAGSTAKVGDYRNVADVGVFYTSSHGGFAKDRDSNVVYGIYTESVRDSFFDAVYAHDLDNGYLIYYDAPNSETSSGAEVSEVHYAITSKFVRKWMDFNQNAIVFINACSSYNNDMMNAFLDKGANLYAGWWQPIRGTKALRAARHFFDRMLGTNQYFPETPPQRPFDADLVWNDMILKHLDTTITEWGGAKFGINPVIPSTNLLAPSILQAYKSFIPGESDFYIDGLFGENPGLANARVTVGGDPVAIQEWMSSTKLRLSLPEHGGNVVVKVRGIESNKTQYSEWHAVFDYTYLGRGSLKKHIVFNVNFLADMHKFRINIANPPIFGPAPRIVQVLNTSTATYECSGEYRNPDDTSFVEEWWQGSGTVPISAGSWTFNTSLYDVGTPFGAYLSFSAPFINTGSDDTFGLDGGLGNLTLTLNSAYAIVPGSQQYTDTDVAAEIMWGTITPLYPPDPNGAR
jgi:hypothetical protein